MKIKLSSFFRKLKRRPAVKKVLPSQIFLRPAVIVSILWVAVFRHLKPRMLGRGMVQNQINQNLDLKPSRFPNKHVEIFHRPKPRINRAVIRDVVAPVLPRTRIKRTNPNIIDAQFPQLRQKPRHLRKPARPCTWVKLVNQSSQEIAPLESRIVIKLRGKPSFIYNTFSA